MQKLKRHGKVQVSMILKPRIKSMQFPKSTNITIPNYGKTKVEALIQKLQNHATLKAARRIDTL